MSLIVQTIIIAIVALIINFFSPILAQWVVWLWYLFFGVLLFFKGLNDRKDIKSGVEGDLSGATMLPPAMALVVLICIVFLFLDFSKLHLLWIAPFATLVVEAVTGNLTMRKFEKNILNKYKKN